MEYNTNMSEKKKGEPNLDELWESLTEKERDYLALASVPDWLPGHGDDFLGISVGMSIPEIEDFVRRGLFQRGSSRQFAKEWLTAHDNEIKDIERRIAEESRQPWSAKTVKQEEKNFLANANIMRNNAFHHPDEVRYRMGSQELHDFAKSKLT